ncbi:hypothetical protein H4I96_04040 [Botrytis cinerea]
MLSSYLLNNPRVMPKLKHQPVSLDRGRGNGSPDDDSKTVTMLVSSKQMILTSPVFEAMLGDDRFKEGADLLADDKVDIELPEDDPVAFAIKTARAQVFSEGFAALNGFLERVTEPRSHCDDQDDMFTKMIDVQIKAIKSKIVGLDIQKFQHKPKLLAREGDDFTELEPRKIIAIE